MYNHTNIMGYKIFVDSLSTITIDYGKKQVINTINPHSYITAKNDIFFEKALKNSDLLMPDGSGIVLAAKKINKTNIKKVSGSDLHIFLLKKMNVKNGKVFYMGATQNTLDKIKRKIRIEYPNITVAIYSPPFKPEFSKEDNYTIISKINAFKPDVLFVGMTAPKQEKWLHEHKDQLNFKIASSIGAVFDFYAGTIQRPSQFWVDHNLEWFPRLLKEPKRLWKRNFISTPLFLLELIKYKLRIHR